MTVEEWVEGNFPNLARGNYEITSPHTPRYNCIAWAAGQDHVWWWPDGPYWPDGVDRDDSVQAFVRAFSTLGYEVCDSNKQEIGWEKIAVFADFAGATTHAARQLPDGRWTSKLGKGWDIAHELSGVCGLRYGKVVQLMRRPLS